MRMAFIALEQVAFQRDEHLEAYYMISCTWNNWLQHWGKMEYLERRFQTPRWQDSYALTEKGVQALDAFWGIAQSPSE